MKNKKKWYFLVLILLIIVLFFYVLHLRTRNEATPNAIQIAYKGEIIEVKMEDILFQDVVGEIQNGKGEKIEINKKGVSIDTLLKEYDYLSIKAISDDEYSATIFKEEAGNAYLVLNDEGMQLIVFGDKNSKRNVKMVIRLELE